MGILANGIIVSLSLCLSRVRARRPGSLIPRRRCRRRRRRCRRRRRRRRRKHGLILTLCESAWAPASEINARGPVFTRKYGG